MPLNRETPTSTILTEVHALATNAAIDTSEMRPLLVSLLSLRHVLYQNRDKSEVFQIQAALMIEMARRGLTDDALPLALEWLISGHTAYHQAVAARVLSYGPIIPEPAVPALIASLSPNFHDDSVVLTPGIDAAEWTTVRRESLRALRRLKHCPAELQIPLQHFAERLRHQGAGNLTALEAEERQDIEAVLAAVKVE